MNTTTRRIPLIHSTDIRHPYGDLDDDFDLAACFAFPEYDLKGVILESLSSLGASLEHSFCASRYPSPCGHSGAQ